MQDSTLRHNLRLKTRQSWLQTGTTGQYEVLDGPVQSEVDDGELNTRAGGYWSIAAPANDGS